MSFNRRKKLIILCFVVISFLIVLSACGIRGKLNEGDAPTIRITSYTGRDTKEEAQDETLPYQHQIFWEANSQIGSIKGYAYRILDQTGNPLQTAGNYYIDYEGLVTPSNVTNYSEYDLSKNGWVLHYEKGAKEDFPLDNEKAQRTIWTDNVFAIVNFPGTSSLDDAGTPSYFEVIAIDTRGKISKPAVKHFNIVSTKSGLSISTSQGGFSSDPSQPIGQGVRVVFSFISNPVLSQSTKEWYYEYRLFTVDTGVYSTVEPEDLYNNLLVDLTNGWQSTRNYPKIDEVVFNKDRLSSDYDGEAIVPSRIHILEAQVTDLAGVTSDIKRVVFYVSDKYSPETIMYLRHSETFSNLHYILNTPQNETIRITIPYGQASSDGYRFAKLFQVHSVYESGNDTPVDLYWSVVGNENTRMWLRFGYYGQYGEIKKSDDADKDDEITVTNYPENTEIAITYDRYARDETGSRINYKSEITHFDIRLNGKPYLYQPLMNSITEDGWLRVPINHELARSFLLSVSDKVHNVIYEGDIDNVFTVAAVDLQGVRDREPYEFRFRYYQPKPFNERHGVLYIDYNTQINNGLKDFYGEIINETAAKSLTYVNRRILRDEVANFRRTNNVHFEGGQNNDLLMGSPDILALSFLQQFRYVIIGSENLSSQFSEFTNELDVFKKYIQINGNCIIVANNNISALYSEPNDLPVLNNLFGFPKYTSNIKTILNPSLQFFLRAAKLAQPIVGCTDLDIESVNIHSLFSALQTRIESSGAIGFFSYFYPGTLDGGQPLFLFDTATQEKAIFRSGDVTAYYKISDLEYNADITYWNDRYYNDMKNELQNSIVAFRKTTGQSTNYTFGFPLCSMEINDVKNLFKNIIK